MKKKYSFLIFFLVVFLGGNLFSQNKRGGFRGGGEKPPQVTVTGSVKDLATGEPLEYATISLQHKKISKLLNGGITDSKGGFSVETMAGVYDIKIEYISFKTKELKDVRIIEDTNLGVFELEIDSENLEEIELIAEKTQVEIKLDKKIYNVGKDLMVRGGTASDILDNIPSVAVDVEGNVSLRGNDNVRILINGRPSGLVGLSSTEALRNFPAEMIEKVEVITNPSSRYDAEGTAGILNIVLRKGEKSGINASISTSVGIPDNYGASINLNFRSTKFNLFTNDGINYRKGPGEGFNNVIYQDGSSLNSNRENERGGLGYNINVGAEYLPTDKSSLSLSYLFRERDNENVSEINYNDFDINGSPTRTSIRTDNEKEIDYVREVVLNFSNEFNKKDHEISSTFKYDNNSEVENSDYKETTSFPTGEEDLIQRSNNAEFAENILVQTDYVLPIKTNGRFELGYKLDRKSISNDYIVEDLEDDKWKTLESYTNTLEYVEYVNAFYSQYGSKLNKFSYFLGLRMENTNTTIGLKNISGSEINRDYTDFFPSVNLGYEFSESLKLNVSYSKRIRRPWLRFINPFLTFSDNRNRFEGNPNLLPTYTSSYETGILKRWDKFSINSSVYFQRSTDVFNFILSVTDELTPEGKPITKRSPTNNGLNEKYGVEFLTTFSPKKAWRFTLNFNLFSQSTFGAISPEYNNDNISWFSRFNSKIVLPGKIDFQTQVFYRGPSENGLVERKGILSTNLAFSKDVLKNNGTLTFNVSDLFNSRKRSTISREGNRYTENEYQYRKRQLRLSFTYRINQKKKNTRRRQGGDSNEEEF